MVSGLAASFSAFMASAPPIPVVVLCATLVGPLLVLVHELGHACVARFLSGRPVAIEVGGAGPAVRGEAKGLTVTLRARRGRRAFAGVALYDPTEVTPVGAILIAIAGPAASAAGALATGRLLGGAHGVAHTLLWVATAEGWLGAIVNLVPMSVSRRRGEPAVQTDGLRVVRAARVIMRGARLSPAHAPCRPSAIHAARSGSVSR